MKNTKKKTVVIGSGISGMALAALLGREGHDVLVLEKNRQTGGRARVYKDRGFHFDMGPSWYMMPEVFDDFFSLFGKKTNDFYRLLRLKEHYKVFFSKDESYSIKKDLKDNLDLFEHIEKGAKEKLSRYLELAGGIYNKAMKELVYYDYRNLKKLFDLKLIKDILSFKLHKNFHSLSREYFSDRRLQQILEYTTVFLGGSPYNTPAFYSLISYCDFVLGIYHPMGGIRKVIDALENLCKINGVTIKTGEEVKKINFQDNKAVGVETAKGKYPADIVVSAADYKHTEEKLIGLSRANYTLSYWRSKVLSPSAFLIYLGIKGKIKKAAHHNLFFAEKWKDHFLSVYDKPAWPDNPSFYVHCPTVTDPALAPLGCDALIFLVPIAPGLKSDRQTGKAFAQKVISKFEVLTGCEIAKRAVVKKIFTVEDFIRDYNSYRGSAFGLAHTLFQTALFRPKNHNRKIKNLYYTGQYTNPGIGMPICLISARITAGMILNDHG